MRVFALIGQLRVVLVALLASLSVTALGMLIAHFGLEADMSAAENRTLRAEVRRLVEHTAEVDAALTQVNAQRRSLDEMTQAAVTAVLGTTQVQPAAEAHVFLATLPSDGRFGGAAGAQALNDGARDDAAGDVSEEVAYDSALSHLAATRQQAAGLLRDLRATEGAVALRQEVLAAIPSRMPAKGWISSGFGVRVSPFHGTEERMHNGIDVAAPEGTPVYATADGTVAFAGTFGGFGKYIRIEHGFGITTRFAHNGELLVKKGQKVRRGEQIAVIGVTGRTTGPHVHYEVLIHDKPVDPATFLFESKQMEAPVVGAATAAVRPMGGDAPDRRDEPAAEQGALAGGTPAAAEEAAALGGSDAADQPAGLLHVFAGEQLVFAAALPLPLRHATTTDIMLLALVLIMLTVAGAVVRVPEGMAQLMPAPAGAVYDQPLAARRRSPKTFDWGLWTGAGKDGDEDGDSDVED